MRVRFLAAAVAVALLAAAPVAHANFYLHKTIDLSPVFNAASPAGSSPFSVAYDGVSAYVGGYNETGAPSTIAIVRIDSLPLGQTSTFTTLPGSVVSANNLEGFNSVILGNGALFGGKDNANLGGNIIVSVDPVTGVANAGFGAGGVLTNPGGRTRMHGGIAWDPGYAGSGSGVSHLESGQGRRQQVDPATGAEVYGISGDPAPGFVVFISAIGSTYRGHVYDPATGDLYIRTKNNVQKSVRTGVNAASGATQIVDLTDADTVVGQNIEFISAGIASGGTPLLVFNNRSAIGAGQAFTSQVLLTTNAGAATGVQLLDAYGNPLALETGNALYDFAYSSANDSLIVSDYYNRKLYLFQNAPVPEPGSLVTLAGAMAGFALTLRRRSR